MSIIAPSGKRKSWYYDIQIKGERFCRGGFPTNEEARLAEKELKTKMVGVIRWQDQKLCPYEKAIRKRPFNSSETSKIGDKTEGIILATFLSLGKTVLIPFGNSNRYDLVIDTKDEFIKIQCKTGKRNESKTAIEFRVSSKVYGTKIARSYINDVDCFAVYCAQTRGIYIVPVNIIGNGRGILKLYKPKENASDQEKYAEDFEIGKFTINSLKK